MDECTVKLSLFVGAVCLCVCVMCPDSCSNRVQGGAALCCKWRSLPAYQQFLWDVATSGAVAVPQCAGEQRVLSMSSTLTHPFIHPLMRLRECRPSW